MRRTCRRGDTILKQKNAFPLAMEVVKEMQTDFLEKRNAKLDARPRVSFNKNQETKALCMHVFKLYDEIEITTLVFRLRTVVPHEETMHVWSSD